MHWTLNLQLLKLYQLTAKQVNIPIFQLVDREIFPHVHSKLLEILRTVHK